MVNGKRAAVLNENDRARKLVLDRLSDHATEYGIEYLIVVMDAEGMGTCATSVGLETEDMRAMLDFARVSLNGAPEVVTSDEPWPEDHSNKVKKLQ
jgi:hypothetical protein